METLKEEKATSKSPMLEKDKQNKDNNNKNKIKKKYNESRDPFYRKFFGRLNNKKERALVRQNLGRLMEEPSYRFRCCPWNLWTTSFILLIFDIFSTYVLYHTYKNTA